MRKLNYSKGWINPVLIHLLFSICLISSCLPILGFGSETQGRKALGPLNVDELLKYVNKRTARTSSEPISKELSLDRAAKFLDSVTLQWHKGGKGCVSCHTSLPYLASRTHLKWKSPAEKVIREIFEKQARSQSRAGKQKKPEALNLVPVATGLALHDAATTGKLHPATKAVLETMLTLQREDGGWSWKNRYNHRPFEKDESYGAAMAGLALAAAPGDFFETPAAARSILKLKAYLRNRPPPNLFHKMFWLWASLYRVEYLTLAARKELMNEIFAKQNADGGWSTMKLGPWVGLHKNSVRDYSSDGMSTGLVVYLARRMKIPLEDSHLKRGLGWLRSNQRLSGKWYTPSIGKGRSSYISNSGTAFAALALAIE